MTAGIVGLGLIGGSLALALVLFAGIRERLELEDVPESFRGPPIALVTAGILAMAFMGFWGLVLTLAGTKTMGLRHVAAPSFLSRPII